MLLVPVIQKMYLYWQILDEAYSFNQLLAFFFLFSMLGWLLEALYRSVSQGRLLNPGFLKGPLVPLYGNAGVFIMITIVFTHNETMLTRLLIYFSAITIMEFVTGEVMMRLFKRRYWDYTDNALNVRGHVCLPFSIAWAVLSLIFEKTLYPLSMMLAGLIDDQQLMMINGAAILILQADFVYSAGIWRPGQLLAFSRNLNRQFKQILPGLSIQQLLEPPSALKDRMERIKQSKQRLIRHRKKGRGE